MFDAGYRLSDSCLVKSDELANRDILRVVFEGIASDLLTVEVDVAIEHELHLARQVLGIFALEQQSDFRRDDVEGPALVACDDRCAAGKCLDGDEPERLVARGQQRDGGTTVQMAQHVMGLVMHEVHVPEAELLCQRSHFPEELAISGDDRGDSVTLVERGSVEQDVDALEMRELARERDDVVVIAVNVKAGEHLATLLSSG